LFCFHVRAPEERGLYTPADAGVALGGGDEKIAVEALVASTSSLSLSGEFTFAR
jgi:hypothetical protein